MPQTLFRFVWAWTLWASAACIPGHAQPATVAQDTLPNGIRLAAICYPGSTNESVITFCPMGLVGDGPGQAQWAHLVEHLVIRSTMPATSFSANAETLANFVHLDFSGAVENYQEGLSHHRRWLEGVPFTAQSLAAEKPKVNRECDITAQNFATHKFALAAWNQAYRFGQEKVGLKADVRRAGLTALQHHRDEHLVVLDKVLVCAVGGVDAKSALALAAKEFGGMHSSASLPPAVHTRGHPREVTWDLNARHLLITWPIPDPPHPDYAALMAAAQWLMLRFFADAELKSATGLALVGVDLSAPEGTFFYVSASLKPAATFAGVEKQLNQSLEVLRTSQKDLAMLPFLGAQLARMLNHLPDRALLTAQTPANISAGLLEANAGLQWALPEFRYGDQRGQLATQLAAVTSAQVQQAATKYLSPTNSFICRLRPDRAL